jgi:ferredoxin
MMNFIANSLLILIGLITFLYLITFAILSLREGERRATAIAFLMAIALSSPFFLATLSTLQVKWVLLGMVGAIGSLGLILFILPIGSVERGHDVPPKRFDERDIVFARRRLKPGSPEFEAYYSMRPEKRDIDDKRRALPGLLSTKALKADAYFFAAADASFAITEAMRDEVDGPVAEERLGFTPAQGTSMIKGLALYYGALAVGICELQPYHVYSHIGRGSGTYGAPISIDHRYAIAFTVEMDYEVMKQAPEAPVVVESARRYVEAATIGLQLGYHIRSMGYPARAHIDGNYRVIAPLVARDAGLGEIGRMGILMTPRLGPRVRLGVVTTDLPLIPDERRYDTSMLDFCRICVKCATNCPSQAIPPEDRLESDGTLRWRINADKCFHYWNVIGTDCGICMSICPYSHPDNWGHNTIRWAIQRSGAARRVALWLDDLFYGQKHIPRPVIKWT